MATLRKERLYQGSLTVSELWSIIIVTESTEVCMALEQWLRGHPGPQAERQTDPQTERQRHIHWTWLGLLKRQSLPLATKFFQQGHIFSNKRTPLNPSNPFS